MEILRAAKRFRLPLVMLLPIALLLVFPARFNGQEQDEYEVKAAFLLKFTKFVEWPFASGSATFGICVLGDDPFETALTDLSQGKAAFNRPIQVRRLKEAADAKSCRIVFVSSAERSKAAQLADVVKSTPVLTVGESEEFLRLGGIIALAMEGSRVNIVINANAAQRSELKISAKLLSLAKIYKDE